MKAQDLKAVFHTLAKAIKYAEIALPPKPGESIHDKMLRQLLASKIYDKLEKLEEEDIKKNAKPHEESIQTANAEELNPNTPSSSTGGCR